MIVVLGSINVDLVVRVAELARPGETVAGDDLALFPGGKGANQAVAAARAGAGVKMVGALGKDGFAEVAMRGLELAGIDVGMVRIVSRPTGVALISVDRNGQNYITVAPGANFTVEAAWLEENLARGDHLALQLEIPLGEVSAAIVRARSSGARVCLNAAPAKEIGEEACSGLDYLVVNETEAAMIAGRFGVAPEPEPFAIAAHRRWGPAVIVTLGADGALAADAAGIHRAPAPHIRAIDTTGAGDTFVGAFLAAMDGARPLARALAEGVAAGSLACMKEGAQTSMPSAAEIKELADRITAV